jgi:hypothetical protein
VIKHDGAAYGDTSLVLHEVGKGAFMVTAPSLEYGDRVEKELGELLER